MMNKPPVIVIIQVRLGSSRLPGKAMLSVSGEPMIKRVIQRVKKCALINGIILACPLSDMETFKKFVPDGAVVVPWPDGNDVLSRYVHTVLQCAKDTVFVRITGDCPCVLPELIDLGIEQHLESGAEYTRLRNDIKDSIAGDGLDFEIFNGTSLIEAAKIIALTKEHICPIFYSKVFKVHKVKTELPDIKLSVNIQEDYDRICKIYDTLGADFDRAELYGYLKNEGVKTV